MGFSWCSRSSARKTCAGLLKFLPPQTKTFMAFPARPHGVIRFQHRPKIHSGSPSQALTPYFSGFLWCRRIGMLPTDHLFRKGAATMRNSQPMIASKLELSPCAVSVLGQLFVEGPTSDDNITSKAGRCDLVSAGLAFHEAGLSSLTPDGVRLAREWDLCSLYARRDRRWYLKVRANPRPEGAAVSHSESGAPVRQDRSAPATPDRARILWRRYPLHRSPQWEGLLVARHSGSDWLIPSQFRMGRSSGATRIWMLLATPG